MGGSNFLRICHVPASISDPHWQIKGFAREILDHGKQTRVKSQKAPSAIYILIMGSFVRAGSMRLIALWEGVEKPDTSVYHGLINGLLKLKMASEATQVFRRILTRHKFIHRNQLKILENRTF